MIGYFICLLSIKDTDKNTFPENTFYDQDD